MQVERYDEARVGALEVSNDRFEPIARDDVMGQFGCGKLPREGSNQLIFTVSYHDGTDAPRCPGHDQGPEPCVCQRVADRYPRRASPILARCHSHPFRRRLVCPADGAVSSAPYGLAHAFSVTQPALHGCEPARTLVFPRRHADRILEGALEVERGQTYDRAQSLQRNALVEMAIDVLERPTEAPLRGRSGGRVGGAAMAGAKPGGLGLSRGGEERHVGGLRPARGTGGTAVDTGSPDRVEQLAVPGPVASVYDFPCLIRVDIQVRERSGHWASGQGSTSHRCSHTPHLDAIRVLRGNSVSTRSSREPGNDSTAHRNARAPPAPRAERMPSRSQRRRTRVRRRASRTT